MAAVTYPNGIQSLGTLVSAATPDGTLTNTTGTIEIGSGGPLEASTSKYLLFYIDYTHGTSDRTSLNVRFQVSADGGSTYYEAENFYYSVASLATFSARVPVDYLSPYENIVRVQCNVAGGTDSGTSTVTIKARIAGVYSVIG